MCHGLPFTLSVVPAFSLFSVFAVILLKILLLKTTKHFKRVQCTESSTFLIEIWKTSKETHFALKTQNCYTNPSRES